MLMTKPKLTHERGDKRTILWKYDGVLTPAEAMKMQEVEGNYHPAGYGFFGFRTDGKTSTWCSAASCD